MSDTELLIIGALAVFAVFFFIKKLVKLAIWCAVLAALGVAVFNYMN